jgi:hypothetical protein
MIGPTLPAPVQDQFAIGLQPRTRLIEWDTLKDLFESLFHTYNSRVGRVSVLEAAVLSVLYPVLIPLLSTFDRILIHLLRGKSICLVRCIQLNCSYLKGLDGDLADADAAGCGCIWATTTKRGLAVGRLNEPQRLLGCQSDE